MLLLALLSTLIAGRAHACIWDYDTLRDEQRGLPGVAEALAGRFEKRSDFFYRDRVARMEAHLKNNLDDQAAIDNYAVALFRLGQSDRAIAVLADKEKRFPDQYTTASNLATFHMLRGEVAPAIPLLEKALRINPNAHFGREEYQLKLARHLNGPTTRLVDGAAVDFLNVRWTTLPEATTEPDAIPAEPIRSLVYGRGDKPDDKAITAILGMIRFGTEQSPDLFLALGNQLAIRGDKHLAIRAYLRAIEAGHPQAEHVKELASELAQTIDPKTTLEAESSAFASERAEAQSWARAYQDYADGLIRDGNNAEDESLYAAFYRQHGPATRVLTPTLNERLDVILPKEPAKRLAAIGITVVGLLIGLAVVASLRLQRRARAARVGKA
jgi:tetratricopeptide (TPR) repeat protein